LLSYLVWLREFAGSMLPAGVAVWNCRVARRFGVGQA
jgi:hypothetical protein